MSLTHSFYLAPLQGFTDFIYRKCHHQLFGGIESYFVPYISIGKGGRIRRSQLREILPENNEGVPVVPQILCADVAEMRLLANEVESLGYKCINLNLGCPYPMATKRGRGTALLEHPEKLRRILDALFTEFNFKVSVKFRGGLTNERTIFERVNLLNDYPFVQLIFHPRTAKQLYKGTANRDIFAEFSRLTQQPIVYNGDIHSVDDLTEISNLVPGQNQWMIGRGVLKDIFLVQKLQNKFLTQEEELELKRQFHQLILDSYMNYYKDEGLVLLKMKQFWSYFSYNFPNPGKMVKPIKKANSISKFMMVYPAIFKNYQE